MNRLCVAILASATVMSLSVETTAQMRLPFLVSHGMVIQRGHAVPIWGWATPGAGVDVMFRDQSYKTEADSAGRWRVELIPMSAGGPFTMRVVSGSELIEVNDVLIGDVWICSGQSNMEWSVRDSRDADAEIASASDRQIRHFKVPRSWSWEPEDQLAGGTWQPAGPETVGDFTAVGYYFAREIRKHVDVPIGLINTSWGGSRIEPWMNAETLGLAENGVEAIQAQVAEREQEIRAALEELVGILPDSDPGLVDGVALWADPDLDDSTWHQIESSEKWEAAGFAGLDGVGWYRKSFELGPEDASGAATLSLNMIDDSDVTWVNGVQVGRMDLAWNEPRTYAIPSGVLRAGKNVVTVRVVDTGGGGGLYGDPELLYIEAASGRHRLDGLWKFNVGEIEVDLGGRKNHVPTVLYNKMIHPLIGYPLTGALWYQGESNAGGADAYEYRGLFRDMIRQWRGQWGQGDFPFLFVQLANFMESQNRPSESDWAVLRESQSAALDLPQTAQAVTIDIGEADDIHPRNKQDVGLRLSLAARKLAYGENDVAYSGPVFRSFEVDAGQVVLEFDHVADGLRFSPVPDSVYGFAVAGVDRQFVWAEARIEDGRVVVASPDVANPVAVRYGWADNPVGANLYNSEGLPAAPFRTDDW